MLSNKKQLSRENLVSEVTERLKTKKEFKNVIEAELVDAVILTMMSVIKEATMTNGCSVVLKPWGKFIPRTRKARTYTDPFGNKVAKPGKEAMAFKPFRCCEKEIPAGSAEEKPNAGEPKDAA